MGSWPGTDVRETLAVVRDLLADPGNGVEGLPYLPELPDRGPGADLVGLQESLTPMLRLSRPRWNHQHCFAGQHGLAHDRTHAIKPSTLLVGNEFNDPHDRFDAVVDLDRAFEE